MMNNKEKSTINELWQYIRKNSITILMVIFIGVMFVSPDAKSFMLRQLMTIGLFNASIDKQATDTLSANDFDFIDEKGRTQNTSSLRGKVVFINFWASWCPPCRAEFPSIEKLYTQFKNDPNIFFLSINEDKDPNKGKTYLNKEEFSIPMYQSNSYMPKEIYSGVLPTTIVLDKNGKIRLHHKGFSNYASNKFIKQIEELINE